MEQLQYEYEKTKYYSVHYKISFDLDGRKWEQVMSYNAPAKSKQEAVNAAISICANACHPDAFWTDKRHAVITNIKIVDVEEKELGRG